jgi:hypothetical protein
LPQKLAPWIRALKIIEPRLKGRDEVRPGAKPRKIAAIAQALQIEGIHKLFKGILDGKGEHRFAIEQGFGDHGVAAVADDMAAGGQVVRKPGSEFFLKVRLPWEASRSKP